MIALKRLESDLERAKDGYSKTLANKPLSEPFVRLLSHLDEFEPRMPEYVRDRHRVQTGRHYSQAAIWKLFRGALDRGLVIKEAHGQYVKTLGREEAMIVCRERIQRIKEKINRAKYKPRARRPPSPEAVVTEPVNPFD